MFGGYPLSGYPLIPASWDAGRTLAGCIGSSQIPLWFGSSVGEGCAANLNYEAFICRPLCDCNRVCVRTPISTEFFLHKLLCADFRFLMWITSVSTIYSRLLDSYSCSGVGLLQFLILYEPWLLVFYIYYTFPVLSANMFLFFYAIICWEETIRNVNLSLLFRKALSEVSTNHLYTPCKPCGRAIGVVVVDKLLQKCGVVRRVCIWGARC